MAPFKTLLCTVLVCAPLALVGCSGGSETATDGATTEAVGAQSTPGSGSTQTTFKNSFNEEGADAVPELHPNEATADDMVAALEKLQVDEPATWVEVIVANRPYAADDEFYMGLREALAEAGADEDLQSRVISILKPMSDVEANTAE